MSRKQTISLSVDKEVYSEYSSKCKDKGLIISKQIENYMKEAMEDEQ